MSSITDLWYTRCPVPTGLGIAVQLGWFADEFGRDGIGLKSIQETADLNARESHFDHNLPSSFRQGGSIPAIWARAKGCETKVIGLSWTDEFQAILSLPGFGIRAPRDLKGRRIGLPVNPISIDFNRATALKGFASALALEGLSLADVERVDTVSSDPPRSGTDGIASGERNRARTRHGYRAEVLALVRGEVDAIYVKGALGLETARLTGAHIVASLGDHPDAWVRANNGTPRPLTVDAALIEQRPDLVERFLARVIAAGDWAATHPDETVAYIARETGSTADWVREAYGANAHGALATFLNDEAIGALTQFKDFLFEHGFLNADFDARGWIDPRPLAAVDARLRQAA